MCANFQSMSNVTMRGHLFSDINQKLLTYNKSMASLDKDLWIYGQNTQIAK